MRQRQQMGGNRLVTARPADDLLDPKLRDLFGEARKLHGEHTAATVEVRRLQGSQMDDEARSADALASAALIRQGRPGNVTEARDKLARDRDEAVRLEAALHAALRLVTEEADDRRYAVAESDEFKALNAKATADLHKALDRAATAYRYWAHRTATRDWYDGWAYQPGFLLPLLDFVDEGRNGESPDRIRVDVATALTQLKEATSE